MNTIISRVRNAMGCCSCASTDVVSNIPAPNTANKTNDVGTEVIQQSSSFNTGDAQNKPVEASPAAKYVVLPSSENNAGTKQDVVRAPEENHS